MAECCLSADLASISSFRLYESNPPNAFQKWLRAVWQLAVGGGVVCVGGLLGEASGMDCADMVIGAAVGRLSRVKDYYTADRSTPRPDQFYGGTQSLTAAIASQSDTGITTVIFRRPLVGKCYSSSLFFCLLNANKRATWPNELLY